MKDEGIKTNSEDAVISDTLDTDESNTNENAVLDDNMSMEDDENLIGMYEESCKRFEEGEVVSGKIVQIDKDVVLIDIGYK